MRMNMDNQDTYAITAVYFEGLSSQNLLAIYPRKPTVSRYRETVGFLFSDTKNLTAFSLIACRNVVLQSALRASHFLFIATAPFGHRVQHRLQAIACFGQGIFYFWRDFCIDLSAHKTAFFH